MKLKWIDVSSEERIIHYAHVRDDHYYVVMSQSAEGFAAFFLTPEDFTFLRNQKSLDESKTACATHSETGHWTPRTKLSDIDLNSPLDGQRRAVRKWMVEGAREYFCNNPRAWKATIEALAGRSLGGSDFGGFEAETERLAGIARAAVQNHGGTK